MKKKSLYADQRAIAEKEAFKPYLAPFISQAQIEAKEKLDWK
jgi:hypothetical protein